MNLNRKIAAEIYQMAIKNNNDLPPYAFDINDVVEGGLTFSPLQPNLKYYFGNIANFEYNIFYRANNGNTGSLTQQHQLEYLFNFFINDLKLIQIEQKVYNVINVYINGVVNPNINWVQSTLNLIESTIQVYSFELSLHLEEKVTNQEGGA